MNTQSTFIIGRPITLLALLISSLLLGCGPSGESEDATATLRQEVVSMEAELAQLKQALPEYKSLLERVDRFRTKLAEASAEATTELHNREARRSLESELKEWINASYIIGNDNTSGIAAIKASEKGDEVMSYARHPFQKFALQAAIQASVPMRADATSETLLASIKSDFEGMGRSRFPLNKKVETIPDVITKFMIFRDAKTDRQKVALSRGGLESRNIQTVDDSSKSVAELALVSGSYWQGTRAEVEPHIEVGLPFLDYCTLSIAEALESSRFKRSNTAISLAVNADKQLQKQFKPSESRIAAGYLPGSEEGRTAPSSSQGKESLDGVIKQIGDDLATRLTGLQWPLLERQYESLVRDEDLRKNAERAGKFSSKASHLVVVELVSSLEGRDSITVKLIDTTTSNTIWQANDKKATLLNRNWKSYLLRSGEPVIVRFKTPKARDEYFAHLRSTQAETPPSSATAIVAVREEAEGGKISLRSPFGLNEWMGNLADMELTSIPSATDADLSPCFQEDLKRELLPYVAYRFARHTLTPAVKMTWPGRYESSSHLQLNIGSADHITPGARFRLQFAAPNGEIGLNQPFLGVVEDVVSARGSRLFVPEFPALTSHLSTKGIAICDSTPMCKSAAYYPLVIVPPGKERTVVQNYLKGNAMAERLHTKLIQVCAERFECGKGEYELSNKNARSRPDWASHIDTEKTATIAAEKGITHVIVTKMEFKSREECRVWIGLQELNKDAKGKWTPGSIVDSVHMTLAENDI